MRHLACVVLAMVSVARPAWAQDMSQQWLRCLDERNAFPADQRIGGCTAIIQAEREVPANMAIAFNGRGNGHASKGEYDRAIEDYDQAIRLNPRSPKPPSRAIASRQGPDRPRHRGLRSGAGLSRTTRWPSTRGYASTWAIRPAIEDFDQVIRLDPNIADLQQPRTAYHHKSQFDRAIEDYDQAIRLDPNNAEAFNNRGDAYSAKGQYDRAIEDYDRAIRLNPNNAEAFYNRGSAYASKGQYGRAIQDYDQAIRLNPNDASPWTAAATPRPAPALWQKRWQTATRRCGWCPATRTSSTAVVSPT